jgi:oligopeptide/dipeptide ABC transporter ATP-binding protein
MIFQHPRSSLNPVFSIGGQLMEVLQIHRGMDRKLAREQAAQLLELMEIPDTERSARAYPHELSGGQAQRAMIAMALAASPDLLIADEPTTALDVTVQAQILELLKKRSSQDGTAIILITHDLSVIAETVDRVAVMYAGTIVEKAGVEDLFAKPLHPYTQALLAAIPAGDGSRGSPQAIPGAAPNPAQLPMGCRFAPRCRKKDEFGLQICDLHEPDELWLASDRSIRCWLYQDFGDHQAPVRFE